MWSTLPCILPLAGPIVQPWASVSWKRRSSTLGVLIAEPEFQIPTASAPGASARIIATACGGMSGYALAGRRAALSNVRALFEGCIVHLAIAVVASLLPVLCHGVRCSASRYTRLQQIRMRVGGLVL